MNLISGIYYSCEKKKYAFMILREYTPIFPHIHIGSANLHMFDIYGNLLQVTTKRLLFFLKPKQVSIAKRASLYMYTTIHAISLKVVWMWLSLAVYAGNRTYHKYAKLVSSSKVFVVWFLNSLILVLCKASNFIPIYLISSIFLFASCIIHIHDRIKFGDKLVCT